MDFCLTLAAGGIESVFADLVLATEGLGSVFAFFCFFIFSSFRDLSWSFLIHIQKSDPEKLVESVKISRQGGQKTDLEGCLFCMAKSENRVSFFMNELST